MIRIRREVEIGALALKGLLCAPEKASALVIFAHGSDSFRLSPRNSYVAEALRGSGLATLLLGTFSRPMRSSAAATSSTFLCWRRGFRSRPPGAGGDCAALHRLFWRKHGGGRGARGRSRRSPHLRGCLARRTRRLLAGVNEQRTLARLRGLRSDLIDPAIPAYHRRIVKRTGNGSVVESNELFSWCSPAARSSDFSSARSGSRAR